MLLSNIRDWLKESDIADYYYIGKIDAKKDKSLGVYQRSGSYAPVIALGRRETYKIKHISLLLHWNKNADETEQAVEALYQFVNSATVPFMIGTTKVYFISFISSEPIDVGTDNSGVYERMIGIDLYYENEIGGL